MNKYTKNYYTLKSYNRMKRNTILLSNTKYFKSVIKRLYGVKVIFSRNNSEYLMKYRHYNKTMIVGLNNINMRFTKNRYDEKERLLSNEIINAIEHEYQHYLDKKNIKITIKNRYDETSNIFDNNLHPIFKISEINSISREMFIELYNKNIFDSNITWTYLINNTSWGRVLNGFMEQYCDNEFTRLYNILKRLYTSNVILFKRQYKLYKHKK